jgi:Ca2+/Na+ antiporter
MNAEGNPPPLQEPKPPIWLEIDDIPVGSFFLLVVAIFISGISSNLNYLFVISGIVAYCACLLCAILFLQANKRKADAEDAISGHVEEEKFGKGTFVMGIIAILFGSVPTTLGVLMAYPSISMTDNILNSSGLDIAGTTFGGLFVASIGLGIILIGLVCIWEYINQK